MLILVSDSQLVIDTLSQNSKGICCEKSDETELRNLDLDFRLNPYIFTYLGSIGWPQLLFYKLFKITLINLITFPDGLKLKHDKYC